MTLKVLETGEFAAWMAGLQDRRARARIQARIDRAKLGNLGDVKSVGEGVSEMRIAYGPGYRVYFVRRSAVVVMLLCGGDKSTQAADIAKAIDMSKRV